VLGAIGGSLTGTVHGRPDDPWVRDAVTVLEQQAGRLVAGGVPTGVAVVPAMHHGGPYPATTSPLHTSVGTAAIRRFLRPVAFQDFPDELLPLSLADANPWHIERVVDGRRTTDAVLRATAL
jgi:NADP-dependent aldehyde dehydrogenase